MNSNIQDKQQSVSFSNIAIHHNFYPKCKDEIQKPILEGRSLKCKILQDCSLSTTVALEELQGSHDDTGSSLKTR